MKLPVDATSPGFCPFVCILYTPCCAAKTPLPERLLTNWDDCRICDENSAQNFSWLRKKTALSLLKRSTHFKGGIRRKQLAIWAKLKHLLDVVKF